jgi:tetratricopeptide (TPR) repeat protein
MPALLLCAAAAALLTACSSAPKAPDAVILRRNEAVRLVALGAKAVREGSPAEAVPFYAEAYRLSTTVADDDNRLAALDGLASLYARTPALADGADESATTPAAKAAPAGEASPEVSPWGTAPAGSEACMALAREIADVSGRADLAAFVSLGEAEAALRSGNEAGNRKAAELALGAAGALDKRPDDKSRALRVLGEARKNLGDPTGALSALSEAAALDQKAKRFAEYAAARYLAASVHSKLGDYPAARTALLEALEADRRAENPAGIGSDFRALGIVEEKAGDRKLAARYYARARDVFAAARFSSDAEDAEARRAALD